MVARVGEGAVSASADGGGAEGLAAKLALELAHESGYAGGMLANPGFSIVCNEMTQGMMIVDTVKHRGRIDAQKGQHIVYVEYIESAPWNRAELFDSPRYQGVGSILVAAAVSQSEELEFQGRVGLHSLPQADAFYTDTCGMTDLGPDLNYRGLRYFEMTPIQAQEFIAKGRSK